MKCGLLGRRLSHSYSPQIHAMLGSYSYDLFEVEPESLSAFFSNNDFTGLNVTVPYKKEVIAHLDMLTPQAKRLGAVNTIVRQSDGLLIGHNTDYYGFKSLLAKTGIQVRGKKVLVLGSGGASNTAVSALNEQGANTVVISRSGEDNYSNLSRHTDAAVIVNTTPVGMYPHSGESPLSLDNFLKLEGVVDLIYNPSKTKLLLDAERKGIPCCNGLWMLAAQAKEAAEWFTGSPIPDRRIGEIHTHLEKQMCNIILVGMPGSGKTTIGALLAKRLSRPFVDSDAYIESLAGMTIPDIFSRYGEEEFRNLESQALAQLGQRSGIVLATGGGCVTIPRNQSLLRQNGQVFWIQRDIALLATAGRPLSQKFSAEELYRQRKDLYDDFSDYSVVNNGKIEDIVEGIVKIWEDAL